MKEICGILTVVLCILGIVFAVVVFAAVATPWVARLSQLSEYAACQVFNDDRYCTNPF